MSVALAQREISAAEFASWRAFDRICPIAGGGLELPTAEHAAMYAAAHLPEKHEPPAVSDFMPCLAGGGDGDQPQSPEEMLDVLRGL